MIDDQFSAIRTGSSVKGCGQG